MKGQRDKGACVGVDIRIEALAKLSLEAPAGWDGLSRSTSYSIMDTAESQVVQSERSIFNEATSGARRYFHLTIVVLNKP